MWPWKVTDEGIQVLWDDYTKKVWVHTPENNTWIMTPKVARDLLTLLKNRGRRKLFCKMLEAAIKGAE